MSDIEKAQFSHRIPISLKTNFQVKVLKNKDEYGTGTDVIEKLVRYFIKNGLPEKA